MRWRGGGGRCGENAVMLNGGGAHILSARICGIFRVYNAKNAIQNRGRPAPQRAR
jgi:hypothetical protein